MNRIRGTEPDLLILEADTPAVDFTRKVAVRVRSEMKIPVWACGQHASILPHSFRETMDDGGLLFDGCLVGEYDALIPRFLESCGNGDDMSGIMGILRFRENGGDRTDPDPVEPAQVDDLDQLPGIPYDLLPLSRYRIYSSQVPVFHPLRWGFCLTSRGCPYQCIYCSPTLRQSFGSAYRQQSADRVVADMEEQRTRIGVNAIFMEDDIFSLDRERTLEVCKQLGRRNAPVPFIIQTRLDALDTERIGALKAAGCVGITAGVESGADSTLERLRKGTTLERMLESAREIRRQGIPLTAYYMIGAPGETPEEMEATLRTAKEIDALMIQVAFFTPYPGSPVHQKLTGEEQENTARLSHYNALAVNLSQVEESELRAFQKKFYREYYLSVRYAWNYLRRRFLYAVFNNRELSLLWQTARYLFGRVPDPVSGD